MFQHRRILRAHNAFGLTSATFAISIITACTSSSGNDAGSGPASCAMEGAATTGPPDMHCMLTQHVDPATCHSGAGAGTDGGGDDGGCAYGDTMYGMESYDDDCKYHLIWSSTTICEGAAGVTFTVVMTNKMDGSKVTGANPRVEVFTSAQPDASCDIGSTHPGRNYGVKFQEGPPGTYTGPIVFDQPGLWTVRFHFYEECDDSPTSPHGHAAYHITVP